MKTLREYFEQEAATYNRPRLGDDFAINAREECLLETYVCDEREDGIVLHADDRMMSLLEGYGWLESEETDECDYDIDSEESEDDVIEPADRGEYDDEAGMAKDDLHTIVRAARRLNGMLDNDENMPEWVQSKITKAADYVDTAADYIESKKDQSVAEAAGQYRVILTLKDDSAGPGESATQRVNVSVSAADEQSAIAQAKQKLIKSPRYSGSRIVGAKIQQGVAEGDYDIRQDPTYQKYNPETHAVMYKDGKHKLVKHDQVANARTLGWKVRSSLKAFTKGQSGVAEAEMDEAKYRGREVPLGKPMKGDVKKSKVYVKGPKGNVVKVNFGDPNMRIKKSSPKHRKSFRARHHCDNPGPRWKARYWSCRAW